jgi:nitroreductase
MLRTEKQTPQFSATGLRFGVVAARYNSALADALLSVTYALSLGDPQGTTLLSGNVSRRHDFGFSEKKSEIRVRAPWTELEKVSWLHGEEAFLLVNEQLVQLDQVRMHHTGQRAKFTLETVQRPRIAHG